MKRKKKTKVGLKSLVFSIALILITVVGLPFFRDELTTFDEIIFDGPQKQVPWYWLDDNYRIYSQITVQNDDFNTIQEDDYLALKFNHKALVDNEKSNITGSDIKLVYFTGFDYKDLDLRLKSPNTTDTIVYFKAARDIDVKSKDGNYYLYYSNGNITDQEVNQTAPVTTTTNYKIDIQDEVQAAFEVNLSRKWVLKGNSLSAEQTQLNIDIITKNINVNIENVVISIQNKSNTYTFSPTEKSIDKFKLTMDTEDIQPGQYTVIAIIKDTSYTAQSETLNISYPLFAIWSMDFEGFALKTTYMNSMDEISSKYQMPITQLFNPRIFIASDVSKSNQEEMVNWVLKRQKENGDEIGLHMHMHLDMIAAAGLTPKTDPRWGGRLNGHDVLTTAYNYEEFAQLVDWALNQFEANGLPKPITYRGGGWFIDEENIDVLDDRGFKIETSGREAVIYGPNKQENPWDLTSTTVPYQISKVDQNRGDLDPKFNIWEFPNNGVNSTGYSGADMIARFDDNFTGQPLIQSQAITFLSHPHWFDIYDKKPLEELFDHIELMKYENDNGPVIYTTLEEAYKEWAY